MKTEANERIGGRVVIEAELAAEILSVPHGPVGEVDER